MSSKISVKQLEQRYLRLKKKLESLDLILVGSIKERYDFRKDSTGKTKQYGPYYQWTFKQNGKTVTINLTKQQAKIYGKAIKNNQVLNNIILDMRKISRSILDSTTQGVKKRNS